MKNGVFYGGVFCLLVQFISLPVMAARPFVTDDPGINENGGDQEGFNWWQAGARVYITDWLHWDIGFGGDFENPVGFTMTSGIDIVFPIKKK